ncbi:6-hexanolactone hydrolase [Ilyonectria destructans]|nr:6-hexanolactone hydrolase [Ilyonectria destructans]
MSSNNSLPIDDLYLFIKDRLANVDPADIASRRLVLETLHSATAEPTGVTYEEVNCPGTNRPAIWCKPVEGSLSHVVLYMHGGAGFSGSPSSHRKLVGHLAKAAGCYALILDYGLVPEKPFPAGLNDVVAAYEWLLQAGFSGDRIATAGDSAGGNLAIATILKAKERGLPLPACSLAFSPWLDMENTGTSMRENTGKDLLATPETLELISSLYLGGTSPKDPFANPLYGNFTGFPPLYLNSGGAELLADNAERLAEQAKSAGCLVELDVVPGMQHVYVLMAGRETAANDTIAKAGKWLKRHFKL